MAGAPGGKRKLGCCGNFSVAGVGVGSGDRKYRLEAIHGFWVAMHGEQEIAHGDVGGYGVGTGSQGGKELLLRPGQIALIDAELPQQSEGFRIIWMSGQIGTQKRLGSLELMRCA